MPYEFWYGLFREYLISHQISYWNMRRITRMATAIRMARNLQPTLQLKMRVVATERRVTLVGTAIFKNASFHLQTVLKQQKKVSVYNVRSFNIVLEEKTTYCKLCFKLAWEWSSTCSAWQEFLQPAYFSLIVHEKKTAMECFLFQKYRIPFPLNYSIHYGFIFFFSSFHFIIIADQSQKIPHSCPNTQHFF